jgi:PAS domain S-box-containing protein
MKGWPGQELHPEAYRALVEGAPAVLYIDRPDELSTNLYTSPQIVELLGYSVEEWMRDAELVRAVHPADRERVVQEHRASDVEGKRFLCEYRILAKDGHEVWIRDEAVPVNADDGTILYWRGVMVDITAQKQAEDQLRASLEDVRRMMSQRRDLAHLLETAQEEERRRIAADIHDDPIQVMSAVEMRLRLLLDRPERIDAQEFGELAEELRSAIDRLRNLLFELRPVPLDLEGLTPAIGIYLEHAAKETGWTWENVRKHANASHVEVRLASRDRGLLLRIVDDGEGFDPFETPLPGHLGLATMAERAELAGGWCRIKSRPDEGSVLECWMPLGEPVEAS